MSRIDVQMLVLAFERRIEALEKNPPDKVSTGVIVNMLEKSIDEIIKDHFVHLIRVDIKNQVNKEFKEMKKKFISKTVENMLSDEGFRQGIEKKIKQFILDGVKNV